jgi:uridine kinase
LDACAALKKLRSLLRTRSARTLVGVDGVLGSGKADFADTLGGLLTECGIPVVRISMKDFLFPKAVREELGDRTGRGYYENSFNLAAFMEDVIEPLRPDGSGRYLLRYYDGDAECDCPHKWAIAPDDSVVIVDGMFLHRREFTETRKVWNYSVWLEVPFDEAFGRLALSNGFDPDPYAESNSRFLDAQRLYLERCDPAAHADFVVENTAPLGPVD